MTLTPQERAEMRQWNEDYRRGFFSPPGPHKTWPLEMDGLVADNEKLLSALEEMREDLMRCGSLAVSDRLDGSLGRLKAERIRDIAYRACWPETKP